MLEQLDCIRKELKHDLDKERYHHTLGVMYTASCLAMKYQMDLFEKALLAGLLHDCGKCMDDDKKIALCQKHKVAIRPIEEKNPSLLHAKAGAIIAQKKYDIHEEDVLHAIKVHTTGIPNMSLLDKIIFVADYIEPNRDKAPHLESIRKMAFEDIDGAIKMILEDTLSFLNHKQGAIDERTQETYDYYCNRKE